MNKQKTSKGRGIEWTDYTWNPIAGCFHACQWTMPDGKVANCYAEDVAERVAGHAYPEGFEHHYWYPQRLEEPGKVKEPSRIFVGSMADVMGHWVSDAQIQQVIDVTRANPQHTFQFLTKNPKRYQQFDFPQNCWLGASTPPDFMWNKPLSVDQKKRMLKVTLEALAIKKNTTWLSAEPLSWDIFDILDWHLYSEWFPIRWIVIGAASDGKKYFPPSEQYVQSIVKVAPAYGLSVFYKGNLHSLPWAAANWREEFPL